MSRSRSARRPHGRRDTARRRARLRRPSGSGRPSRRSPCGPRSDHPVIVATVTGTDRDPQPRNAQVRTLAGAGVIVAGSHADAASMAIAAIGGIEMFRSVDERRNDLGRPSPACGGGVGRGKVGRGRRPYCAIGTFPARILPTGRACRGRRRLRSQHLSALRGHVRRLGEPAIGNGPLTLIADFGALSGKVDSDLEPKSIGVDGAKIGATTSSPACGGGTGEGTTSVRPTCPLPVPPQAGRGAPSLAARPRIASRSACFIFGPRCHDRPARLGSTSTNMKVCGRRPRWPRSRSHLRPADVHGAIVRLIARGSRGRSWPSVLFENWAWGETALAPIDARALRGLEFWLCDTLETDHVAISASSEAIAGLIGLVPGPTPSGDDFLVGVLHPGRARRKESSRRTGSVIADSPRGLTLPERLLSAGGRRRPCGRASLLRHLGGHFAGALDTAVAAIRRIGTVRDGT